MQLYGGKATKLEADSVLLRDMNAALHRRHL